MAPAAPAAPAAAEKALTLTFPVMLTPARPPAVQVIVIGAGGTGGRVLAPLVKMLRQGDRLDIMDADVVEGRNLLRQHFTEKNIGVNKAEVAVSRLKGEARRVGLTLGAWPAMATAESLKGLMQEGRGFGGRIIIGCVDNREARKAMEIAYKSLGSSAWLDAGNETSGGQVMLSLHKWPIWAITQDGRKEGPFFQADRGQLRTTWQPEAYATCETLKSLLPALIDPKVKTPAELAAEACAIRIDTQTVSANQMAAALLTNMLGWLTDEIPFSNPGAFFHTLNTVKPVVFEPVVRGGAGEFLLTCK